MSGLRRRGEGGGDEGRAAGARCEGVARHLAERVVAAEERWGCGGDAQRFHGAVLGNKIILIRS